MDSVTPKTPDNMYRTPCLTKKMKIANVGCNLAAILEFGQ